MAKSKRNKVVHLTQVKKKGKDHKEDLMKQIEQYVAQFKNVFIFDFDQTKSDRTMALRVKLKQHGRIYSGLNSLVGLTLTKIGERTNTNYEDLIGQVVGKKGLLFTDLSSDRLIKILDKELPEFCKKLVGYARISPEEEEEENEKELSMDLDRNDVVAEIDTNEKGDGAEEEEEGEEGGKKNARATGLRIKKTLKKKKQTTKTKKKKKREVKFVRI